MAKDSLITVEGTVIEDLSNRKYRVELQNGHVIIAYMGGKMKMHHIRVIPGDTVTVELSPYDLNNGRITYRKK